MAIGNDASRGAELIQQGIRQVREGRTPEAYTVFREAVASDPGNEFGWIWLSITSPDQTEKRTALERALQINPNSSHARQALRNLDANATHQPSASLSTQTDRLPVVSTPPPPAKRGLSARIGEQKFTPPAEVEDNLAQDLRQPDARSRRITPRQTAPTTALVGTRSAGQRFAGAVRVILLSLVGLIIIGLVCFWVYTNVINKPANVAETAVPTVISPAPPTTSALSTGTIETTLAAPIATLAPTISVETALAPSPTPQTALLISPTPPLATVTPNAAQTNAQVTKLLADGQNSVAGNDFKTAIQNFKQALSLDPTNIQANLRLGLAYLTAPAAQLDTPDRYAGAISALQTVTDLAPTWSGGWGQLGAAYAAKGDLLNAIKAYRTSLELDRNGPERWLALAALYERTNQPAEALAARNQAQGTAASATSISPAVTTTITVAVTTNTIPPTTSPATTIAPTTPAQPIITTAPIALPPAPKPTATPAPLVRTTNAVPTATKKP